MSSAAVAYLQTPATIVNESLDSIGQSNKVIGDLTDGGTIAEAARRNYGQVLRHLLRASYWGFARKQAYLTLLGDSTGQTPNISTQVDVPWTYAYAWPIDGVAGRWMPSISPQQTINPPLTTGQFIGQNVPNIPGEFLVSSSSLYPIEVGTLPWDQQPDLQRTFGVGPVVRTIILTNICNAMFVYTAFTPTIEQWDPDFRQAMVALMALTLCPVAIDDPKERILQRNDMIRIAKNTIDDARVKSGNSDFGYPQSTDRLPPWITARSGGFNAWGGNGYNTGTLGLYMPWEPFSLGGNVF